MVRKVETHLVYDVKYGYSGEDADLESIIELTSRLKGAKEQAAATSRDVKVSLRLEGHEAGCCHYYATLAAPDKVRLQDALKVFFREGGLPDSIYGETRVAEELFPPYGKHLKRDFFGDTYIKDA